MTVKHYELRKILFGVTAGGLSGFVLLVVATGEFKWGIAAGILFGVVLIYLGSLVFAKLKA